MDKVRAHINSKTLNMNELQEELDQLNSTLDTQTTALEDINNQISEKQMEGEENTEVMS